MGDSTANLRRNNYVNVFRSLKNFKSSKFSIKLEKKAWWWVKNEINSAKTTIMTAAEAKYYYKARKYAQTKKGAREYNKRIETNYFGGVIFFWNYIWEYSDLKKLKYLKKSVINNLHLRLENYSLVGFTSEDDILGPIWEDLFLPLMPYKYGIISPRIFATIYVFDVLNNYRGWRHTRKMPSHGQRTWTNASSASRHNIWIKKMQRLRGKHMYGRIPADIINVAMQAEKVNLAWKINWNKEWRNERVAFLGADPKSRRKKYKRRVDLYSASTLRLLTLTRISKMTKKQKKTVNRAYYTLGYRSGHTIRLLRKVRWTRKKKTGKIVMRHADNVVLRQRQPRRRRRRIKVLKKVEKRRKIIKHLKKKREKQRKKRTGGRKIKRRRL